MNDEEIGFCMKAADFNESDDNALRVDTIFPYALKSARSVDVIKILIQDTAMRRAPVISRIEVLGVPSFRCSLEEIEEIRSLMKDPERPLENADDVARDSPKADEAFNIPEDFLDAITHELLVMPYILPSGSVIDESTMAKHNKHEECYGRLPSDPFTGMAYTSETQPRFNEALKARLDAFKLQNSHEIDVKLSGRTVGRKHQSDASTSGIIANGHISKKIKFYGSSSSDLDSLISSIYKNNQVSIFTKPTESTGKVIQSCSKCLTTSGIYKITQCSHFFCKPCLLQLSSKCDICKISFESKDVAKINL